MWYGDLAPHIPNYHFDDTEWPSISPGLRALAIRRFFQSGLDFGQIGHRQHLSPVSAPGVQE